MKLVQFKNQDAPRIEKDISNDIVSGEPIQHAQLMFTGNEGKIRSGIWESTAGVFNADYTGIVEFCHILEGSAHIKAEDGQEYSLSAGDGFILDSGLKVVWTVDSFVKKHFMICDV